MYGVVCAHFKPIDRQLFNIICQQLIEFFLSHFNGVQKKLISNLITMQFLVYLCGKSALEFHSAEEKNERQCGLFATVFTIISVFALFIQ